MKRTVFIIILVLGCAACASADVATVRQNLDRYWFYRGIQRTDFLVAGIGQGYSVPACWRNPDTQVMKWADATIDLGWYIGALATEHFMLSRPDLFPGYSSGGGDLGTVRNELYYALSAMDRVDATAEACWDPYAPDTPGFFIRDDVPATFNTHFPGITTVYSDFCDPVLTNKEMSQDQVVHVLLGLSLVKKLIPSDLVVSGMNLRSAAIDRGADIVDWVHQHDWIIYNPVTNIPVNRGEDARSFSTGFNKTCVYLTDGAVDFGGTISAFWAWVWSTLSSPSNPAYDNRNNRHMAMSLASTGNGWGDSNTLDALMSLADAYDWYAYPMLYAVLYDPIPQSRPTWAGHQATFNGLVQTMLNLAPTIGTPHHPLDEGELNTGWCASRRFLQTLDAQNNGEGEFTVGEWYNGLDYLLLHNLFYVVTPSLWEDPSPPGPVANFIATAGDSQVSLSWTNPGDPDFAGTMIRFKTTGYPTSPTDGTQCYNGTGTSTTHTSLTNGTTYYYAAYAYNSVPSYSTAAQASATPSDMTPPAPVTLFTATPGNQQIALAWTNPSTSDFTGTLIRYKTTGYPSSPADGTFLCDRAKTPGSADSYTHSGLTNGITYYYSAFAHDAVPNYATKADASATPVYSEICFTEDFPYPNGNLNGNGGWYGSAATQIVVESQYVKVWGGSTSYDSIRDLVPSCIGDGTTAAVEVKIKRGSGANTAWSLWIDDAAGNNLARWYGTGTSVRGRIAGSGTLVTAPQTLTGEWDTLYVRINFSTNQSAFFFNGVNIGEFSHAETGAGNAIGRLRIERMDNAPAAGNYVYLDHFVAGTLDTSAPSASVGGPSVVVTRTGPVSFQASFSEPVFGFDASSDVEVNAVGSAAAGTVGVTGSGAGPYTVSLSNLTGSGTLGITVKSSSCTDKAGNANTASSASPTVRVIPQDGSIATLKTLPNNQLVEIGNKALYLKQSGFAYIEEPDRWSGMRLQGTITPSVGDLVCLTGTMKTTAGGERYIQVDLISPCGSLSVDPFGSSNFGLLGDLLTGMYVKCWGKVKPGSITSNSYVLTDGSDTNGIKVITPGAPGVVENQFVTPDGAAGYDNARVVYRN